MSALKVGFAAAISLAVLALPTVASARHWHHHHAAPMHHHHHMHM